MKNVLISGVCGLIGSHLADKMLEAGYRVTGMDNLSAGRMENIKDALRNRCFIFKRVDLADAASLRKTAMGVKFDIIVHMAAAKKIGESGSSLKVLRNNADSTIHLLELARHHRAKFIFASTSDVYGLAPDIPFREDSNSVLGPSYIKRWSYAASKLYCEHLVFAYGYEYGLRVVVLRYFGCFGARSNYGPSGGHVPGFIKKALTGGTITIHGSGKQTRSMASVDDVVRGTMLAIESKKAPGKIINIGSDEELSVEKSAMIILDTAKKIGAGAKRAKLRYVSTKDIFGDYKEISRRVPDLTRARKILNYAPRINFKEAVRAAMEGML